MVYLNNFNASQVEPQSVPEPIPAGNYLVRIVESLEKHTQKRTGKYVEFVMEIMDGPYFGRKLWARLNLVNQNQQAVAIARSQLSAICHAVGVLTPNDSVDLHNIPFMVKVGGKKRPDTGEIIPEVKGFMPRKKSSQQTSQNQQVASNYQPAPSAGVQNQQFNQNPPANTNQQTNQNLAPWDR